MVTITSAKNQLENLKKIGKTFEQIYLEELAKRIRSNSVKRYYIELVHQVFDEMQAHYWEGKAEDDPTRFDRFRPQIGREVNKSLNKTAELALGSKGQIHFTVLSDEFLGIGSPPGPKDKNKTKIRWAGFFLSGAFHTDLLWVNEELADKLDMGTNNLGRFGVGFLWELSGDTKEKVQRKFKYRNLDYNNHLHPQSGKEGKDWFEKLITDEEVQVMIVQPAFNKTMERMRNRKRF